ncbi:MAG: CPBP family glutamic-type intramembrane protease [Halanaerobiales bacterium]
MKRYLFFIWIISSLGSLFYFSDLYHIEIPVFTLVWLVLAFLAVLLARDAKYVGFSGVEFSEFLLALFLNLLLLSIIFIVLEPLSGTYREVINNIRRDTTLYPSYFLLSKFSGLYGLLAYFICNFFIIIFAEELFFRGLLIQYAELKLNKFWGVLIQAFLFLLFILILDIRLPPVQNYIFLVGYTFLGRGIIGGWAAARTDSIWPSLLTVSLIHSAVIFMYFYYPVYF